MKEYHTQIEINAPIKKVWQVLTDFKEYPNWNPLVGELTGDVREDGMIRTKILPLNNTYTAKLLSYQKEQEIVWLGKQGAKFLLAGKHYYRLKKLGENKTLLEHGEYFTGLFSHFISGKLLNKMEQAFHEHNKALKSMAENER